MKRNSKALWEQNWLWLVWIATLAIVSLPTGFASAVVPDNVPDVGDSGTSSPLDLPYQVHVPLVQVNGSSPAGRGTPTPTPVVTATPTAPATTGTPLRLPRPHPRRPPLPPPRPHRRLTCHWSPTPGSSLPTPTAPPAPPATCRREAICCIPTITSGAENWAV